MTVKNIMFSGVMAAILGATAAHAADPVQLISKSYADRELQSKLTAGANVAIAADNTISVDLTNYATNTAVTDAITNALAADGDVKKAIDAAVANKQEKLDNADVLSGITAAELSGYDKAVTDSAQALVDAATAQSAAGTAQAAADKAQGEVDALETVVAGKANAADVYSKAEADELLLKKADLEKVYLKTETMTTEQINEAIDKVTSGEIDLQNYYTKQAADDKFIDTTEIEGYATDAELEAVSDVANAAATKTYVDEELGKKADASVLGSYYTKTEADSAFMDSTEVDAKIETATADMASATELAGVKTTAEKGVTDAAAAKAAADAAQEDADANALAIQGLQNAGYVVGTKEAGQYLINFDATGNATYTAVTIVE